MLINLYNIAYGAMKKTLPYQEEAFSKYRPESVQELRLVFGEEIRRQVFYFPTKYRNQHKIKYLHKDYEIIISVVK